MTLDLEQESKTDKLRAAQAEREIARAGQAERVTSAASKSNEITRAAPELTTFENFRFFLPAGRHWPAGRRLPTPVLDQLYPKKFK